MGNVLSVCHRLTFLGVKPYGRHAATSSVLHSQYRSLLSYLPCSTTVTSATSSKRPWTGHGRWTRSKAHAHWCSAFSRYGGCSPSPAFSLMWRASAWHICSAGCPRPLCSLLSDGPLQLSTPQRHNESTLPPSHHAQWGNVLAALSLLEYLNGRSCA